MQYIPNVKQSSSLFSTARTSARKSNATSRPVTPRSCQSIQRIHLRLCSKLAEAINTFIRWCSIIHRPYLSAKVQARQTSTYFQRTPVQSLSSLKYKRTYTLDV